MPGICLTFSEKSKKLLDNIYTDINKANNKTILKLDKYLEPHISLLLTNYNESEKKVIIKSIKKLSKMNKINSINLEGIGIFPKGDNKYNLHFKVAYNETMQKIHKEIWRELGKKINIKQKDHYHPSSFISHVSIPIIKKRNNKTVVMKIANQILNYDVREIKLDIKYLSYINGNLEKPSVYYKNKLNK